LRGVLASRGATFFSDLARDAGGFPREVLDTLWQMVWSGEVTNDTLEPLRSRARAASDPGTRRSRTRPERPSFAAPATKLPGSEGRWSLRSLRVSAPPNDTDRRTALARSLLDRYGLVMRETAHAEGVAGGFAAIYDVLKVLEEKGRIRRGYFVEGRGGAQFALPGADERLRSLRDAPTGPDSRVVVIAATDPANAWGAALDWPPTKHAERPQRSAKALVVLRSGELLGWLSRAGGPLLTFGSDDESARPSASRALADALAGLVDQGDLRALLVSSVDGAPAATSPLGPFLFEAGFTGTTRGLFKRRSARPLHETAAPP
jgi:ATP-dependent Lhr-like helicase